MKGIGMINKSFWKQVRLGFTSILILVCGCVLPAGCVFSRTSANKTIVADSHQESKDNQGLKRRQIDNIDLPFIDDPEVIGRWVSVDFVDKISDFDPSNKRFRGELYLKELTFRPNGKTTEPFWTWTRGKVIHSGDRTAADYFILKIDEKMYLFFEWKSGDYTIRHLKPSYYVLKKKR
jgi:bla regulator protein BlaR1